MTDLLMKFLFFTNSKRDFGFEEYSKLELRR